MDGRIGGDDLDTGNNIFRGRYSHAPYVTRGERELEDRGIWGFVV